jgi:signal peptidase I
VEPVEPVEPSGQLVAVRTRGRHVAAVLAVCGVALVVLVVAFVAEPFRVPTGSMTPTVRPGDHVLVDKLAYRFGDPQRGDLMVFRSPADGETMLKRVVGVGGDTVAIEDGVLHVNRRAVREPYVDHRTIDSVYFGPVIVPAGDVFVMGDRRADSRDSRDFGPVARGEIVGRVDARIWPLQDAGAL